LLLAIIDDDRLLDCLDDDDAPPGVPDDNIDAVDVLYRDVDNDEDVVVVNDDDDDQNDDDPFDDGDDTRDPPAPAPAAEADTTADTTESDELRLPTKRVGCGELGVVSLLSAVLAVVVRC
jgi:hypothetical protein